MATIKELEEQIKRQKVMNAQLMMKQEALGQKKLSTIGTFRKKFQLRSELIKLKHPEAVKVGRKIGRDLGKGLKSFGRTTLKVANRTALVLEKIAEDEAKAARERERGQKKVKKLTKKVSVAKRIKRRRK